MMETLYYTSPIGVLEIKITNEQITALTIKPSAGEAVGGNSAISKQTIEQLDEYFAGKRTSFSLPLHPQGTEFQERVWAELLKIPYAETISYHELARRVGNDKAYRAVGNANGKNPVCLIIPCHRVIQSNGNIGGYAYGVEVKQQLLELEKSTR